MNRWNKLFVCSLIFFSTNVFAHSTRFLALSDIHFNPFDKAQHYPDTKNKDPYGDPNAYYLEEALREVVYLSSHDKKGNVLVASKLPQFIVMTGDSIAHKFQDEFDKNKDISVCKEDISSCVLKTIDYVVDAIRKTQYGLFSCTPIYMAAGNNDSVEHNVIDLSFLRLFGEHIYDYSHPCNANIQDKLRFAESFKEHAGAYIEPRIMDVKGLNLLVLNDILYAKIKGTPDEGPECKDSNNSSIDCSFLREQQNNFIDEFSADGYKPTLVLMHIPPYDAKMGYSEDLLPALDKSLFKGTPEVYTLAGHKNKHIKLKKVNGYMLSALTFRHESQPGFSIFEYDNEKTWEIKHCQIADPKEISGKTAPLSFQCEKE